MDEPRNKSRELVGRIEASDEGAEALLVERYARPLKLILLKRSGDPTLAEDLCQDTFIIALRRLRAGELKNPDALGSFLRQIAVNKFIEHKRKDARFVQQDNEIIELKLPHRDRKSEKQDRQHARKVLQRALFSLSQQRDREILRRFYLLDEDKAEICTALDLSAAHFDRVLYRAKQRMRELLNRDPNVKSLLQGGLFSD